MNILIIARGYPDKNDPQWGGFERDQAEALSSIGHNVVVASVDKRFRLYRRRLGISRRIDGKVVVYNSYYLPNVFFRHWADRIYFKFVFWQMRKIYDIIARECFKPEVIYSHYLSNTALAVGLKKIYQVPVVGLEHWSRLNDKRLSTFVKWLGDNTYPYVDRQIAVSSRLADRISQLFGIEVDVIHNMVNKRFFATHKLTKSETDFIFVNIGSLFPIKGHDILIKAFAETNFGENVKLLIVGDGRRRRYLQNLINTLNLEKKVTLLGRKDKDEIIRILSFSNVFVLSSLSENFSVAVIEGLAMGLPVVATLCGGTDECISDLNGLLVPVGDVAGLSAAMRQIYENYENYNKEVIAEDCKCKYSPEVIVKKLDKVFKEVVSKN